MAEVTGHYVFPRIVRYVFPGITSFTCVWTLRSSVGRGASEREFRASEKDEDNDRLKIVFYFTRGYLGKLKSYRDKSKIVLKGKVLRF